MKKIKQGDLIEVMDRKGLSGDLNEDRSSQGRGNSKCKSPVVGINSACGVAVRRPVSLEHRDRERE